MIPVCFKPEKEVNAMLQRSRLLDVCKSNNPRVALRCALYLVVDICSHHMCKGTENDGAIIPGQKY